MVVKKSQLVELVYRDVYCIVTSDGYHESLELAFDDREFAEQQLRDGCYGGYGATAVRQYFVDEKGELCELHRTGVFLNEKRDDIKRRNARAKLTDEEARLLGVDD